METEKEKKILLCMPFDPQAVLKNQILGSFKQHSGICAECGCQIMLSDASREMIRKDSDFKTICMSCGSVLMSNDGEVKLRVTSAHVREVLLHLGKIKEQNN